MEYLGLPVWGDLLLKGIFYFIGISSAAVALSRAGRSPYFAFMIIFPYVQILAIWVLAYDMWKRKKA